MVGRARCARSRTASALQRFSPLLCAGVLVEEPRAQSFTEEGTARGIQYVVTQRDSFGCGLAFCDLDGDGDDDVVTLGDYEGKVGVYENNGAGLFTDRSVGAGIPPILAASGVVAADYDGDLDLDLYFSNFGTADLLMRNDGGLVFTDVTEAAGLGDTGHGQGCSWADYDGDGWLDLYVGNRTDPGYAPNRLYRNRGDGTFVDVAAALGVDAGVSQTFQATFFDFDRDGLLDIYLCTDHGQGCINQQNFLFRNLGGTFADVTFMSNTQACVGCMGTAIGDFDANGFDDIYCSNTTFYPNVLLLNQGGFCVESAGPAGVASFAFSWSTLFFDYDNDGWLDLYVCNEMTENRLYDNDGVWPVLDVAVAAGASSPYPSYCVAVADVEGDGDLDILLQDRDHRVKLFVNHAGEMRNWLQVELVGAGTNRHAVGASVEIAYGTRTAHQQVLAGTGFKSVSAARAHFGLDAATAVDSLTVRWPGGGETELVDVPANQRLVIEQLETAPLQPGPVGPLRWR